MSTQVRDRLIRIEAAQKLHQEHPEWDERRLVMEICIVSGVRESRATEYVKLLHATGRW